MKRIQSPTESIQMHMLCFGEIYPMNSQFQGEDQLEIPWQIMVKVEGCNMQGNHNRTADNSRVPVSMQMNQDSVRLFSPIVQLSEHHPHLLHNTLDKQ